MKAIISILILIHLPAEDIRIKQKDFTFINPYSYELDNTIQK